MAGAVLLVWAARDVWLWQAWQWWSAAEGFPQSWASSDGASHVCVLNMCVCCAHCHTHVPKLT